VTPWPRAIASLAAGGILLVPALVEAHDLMPAPASVELREGGFSLAESLTVALVGPASERLERAFQRFATRVSGRIERPLGLDLVDPHQAALVIRWEGEPRAFPALGDDESYRLDVTEDHVALEAPGPLGVLRGLATLAQLVAPEGDGLVIRAARIDDAPRFPWRGLMIDVVRHWQPIDVLQRNLDAMEAVKLNVLHLHLTDDQGFRVESRTYPLLHERASDGNYYSQDEIRHLLDYAADRGIRIVPELDVPGHVTSWFVAYPELGSHGDPPGELPPPGGGMFHNALDPTREETYEFVDGLFAEMAGLFPDDYVHIGGDEVSGESWRSNERIQAFMEEYGLSGPRELQAFFTARMLEIVSNRGKVAVGWDEVAHGEVREDTVIQTWLPGADPGDARSIVSSGFYLDHMHSAAVHHGREPLDFVPSEAGLLGGEACMWGEYVIPSTIDSRIWPRTAAIAERLWSPREVRDVEDMYRRLALVRRDLARLGLQHDSYYEPALARFTGGTLSPTLKTLADVVGPPSTLERAFFSARSAGMLLPSFVATSLFDPPPEVGTRLDHVLQPESDVAAAFLADVEAYLASPSPERCRALEERLESWRDNHDEVVELFGAYPHLEEIEPVSAGLAELAELGLAALDVLDGKEPFSEREKRVHRELFELHDPTGLDMWSLEMPEDLKDEDIAEVFPRVVVGFLLDKLKTFEPLILFRVKIQVQPGIETLVLAAHARGTRETGVAEDLAGFLYDRKGTLMSLLGLAALVVLFVRRRRARRAA
jgi:hexosaminidase